MAAPEQHLSGIDLGMIITGIIILTVINAQTGCLMQLFFFASSFSTSLLIVFALSLY
jgi:uncharacterized protein YejL (UPF0352 family)